MKSHTCEFAPKDLARLAGGPLAAVAVFALLMHGGARLRLLPAPRPTLDTDRTILIHQAAASRAPQQAGVLLLGDSSCLMDVSARQLSERIGRPVLNLGTLSYLDPGAQAILLREYAAANPGRLRAVVLLMHPEALRRAGSEPYQLALLEDFLAGRDHFRGDSLGGCIAGLSGVEIFKGRVLARAVPSPLGGAYGRFYGFSDDLEDFMTASQGSAIDPDLSALAGSSEYRLSPVMEKTAREFKAAVPPGVMLLTGLTPVPGNFAGPDFLREHPVLLRQWGQWLGADALLDDLPAALPDDRFARTTHLKPGAVGNYTGTLAASLKTRLP